MMNKISISKIKLFKACRRAYELKYIFKVIPETKSSALETGTNYHEKIENLYKYGSVDIADFSKESAMALAYEKYIYPRFVVDVVEGWTSKQIGEDCELIGRIDGLAVDRSLVEHKTTGATNLDEYEFNLQWDEQILAYMYMTGARSVYYTVCRKPNIRQRKNETEEEFFERMINWFDEDTENKIRLIELYRTDEEIEEFEKQVKEIANEMMKTDNYYRNTCHCSCWGSRCEYSPICLNYDPDMDYVGFRKED